VRTSWAAVAPIQQQAAAIFYDKLFAPALDRLETIVPAVGELGRRHVTYGVRAAHYAVVATALLATLEQGLGAAFTVDVREAWAAAYGVLAGTMQSAASASGEG
jgi:hemoglobin-like flavoprotein